MGLIELFILAVGLSMDAFAVSVCKGLAMTKITVKKTLIVGALVRRVSRPSCLLWAIFWGVQFRDKITAIDHWIAFILLGIIGANMIKEACSGECEEENESLDIKTMFLLAVATSIGRPCRGDHLRFSQRAPARSGILYRGHDIHPVRHRRKDRKRIWNKVQIQSRAGRRRDPYPAGVKDPAGASGDPLISLLEADGSRLPELSRKTTCGT